MKKVCNFSAETEKFVASIPGISDKQQLNAIYQNNRDNFGILWALSNNPNTPIEILQDIVERFQWPKKPGWESLIKNIEYRSQERPNSV